MLKNNICKISVYLEILVKTLQQPFDFHLKIIMSNPWIDDPSQAKSNRWLDDDEEDFDPSRNYLAQVVEKKEYNMVESTKRSLQLLNESEQVGTATAEVKPWGDMG